MYIYKNNFDVLGGTLLSFCNESVQQGISPDQPKISKAIPNFKTGERNLSNYRPISVSSSLSEIVEKVVILLLTEFLNVNNVITSHQFGFQGGLSADNAIHAFFHDIYEAFLNNEIALAVLLDLIRHLIRSITE